jgi:hypothetical protein
VASFSGSRVVYSLVHGARVPSRAPDPFARASRHLTSRRAERARERRARTIDVLSRRPNMFRNLEKLRAALAKMPDAARARVDPNTGRFRAPEFSGRVVGELRKAVIANGMEWTHDAPKGVQKTVERPPKGHKFDREKPLREARRAEALAKQPELIAAYRARMRSKAKGKEKIWDEFILTKREKTLKVRMQDVQGGKK